LPDRFAICRLGRDAPVPDWALTGGFFSVTRTPEELSIVCPQVNVPDGTTCNQGWRGLKVEGPFDFSAIGIIAALAEPLARAGISIFVISTYDTDYLLVKEENLERAIAVLVEHGRAVLKT
jgi:hypothetical protein